MNVRCPRCGNDGVADRIDVSGVDEPPGSQWIWGYLICATEGCFDEEGLPRIPPPDAS